MASTRRRRYHSARYFKVFISLSDHVPISSLTAVNRVHRRHRTRLTGSIAPRAKRLSPGLLALVAQWAEDGFTFGHGSWIIIANTFLRDACLPCILTQYTFYLVLIHRQPKTRSNRGNAPYQARRSSPPKRVMSAPHRVNQSSSKSRAHNHSHRTMSRLHIGHRGCTIYTRAHTQRIKYNL